MFTRTAICNIIIIAIFVYNVQVMYEMWARPVVLTKNGWIRGVQSPDGTYNMFLGIPYALVNDDNPFGTSIPYPRFNNTFDASDDTKICPQIDEVLQIPVGTLQCLNLHVYVPKNPKQLPVLLYIYGGVYRFGYVGRVGNMIMYRPDYLIRHGIIVVEINYRVGIYGFLCLERPDIPGNQGLKDQTLALRWVRDNIAEFGGDPDKITVVGHSSGAMSLGFHVYANPELFQQVILQSGTAFIPKSVTVNPSLPFEIAKRLGNETTDLNEALDSIKKTHVFKVAEVSKNMSFRPCIEKQFDGVKAFISEHPRNVRPNVRNKNVMIGNTADEFTWLIDKDDVFQVNLELEFDVHNTNIINEAKSFYIGDNVMSDEFEEEAVEFYNDISFYYPTHYVIDKYLENNVNKIFYYLFNYTGELNVFKVIRNIESDAVIHGDELGYLFKFSILNDKPFWKDRVIVDRMTTMWTNFVKFGDPTVEKTDLLPIKWLPVSKNRKHCLVINTELIMKDKIFQDRLAFWYNFYKKHERNLKYKKTYK